MTWSWYTGPAHVRQITAATWTALSITNTGDTVWNAANNWAIDEATLSAGQKTYLAGQADFLTNQATGTSSKVVAGAAQPVAPAPVIPSWAANTQYLAGMCVISPTNTVLRRNSAGTSRASYDATEQALWTTIT